MADREVRLVRGSTVLELELVDERGQRETLTDATAASFALKRSLRDEDGDALFTARTGGFGLDMDTAAALFTVTIPEAVSDELPLGVFVASLAVYFGAERRETEPVRVKVLPRGAPKVTVP